MKAVELREFYHLPPTLPYGFLADRKRFGCGKGWGSRKGWVYSAAMPPPKKRDAVALNLGAKFGFGNGQKMREILGFGGGTPNFYFLFISCCKNRFKKIF